MEAAKRPLTGRSSPRSGTSTVEGGCYRRHTLCHRQRSNFASSGRWKRSRPAKPCPWAGRSSALLALLLIHANEVVSVDTLIEELWGESPPRTAPAYVQNCVSRLRKALGTDLLETRPPGYVLRTDPEAIDARRFERLTQEAREAPRR